MARTATRIRHYVDAMAGRGSFKRLEKCIEAAIAREDLAGADALAKVGLGHYGEFNAVRVHNLILEGEWVKASMTARDMILELTQVAGNA